MSKISSYPDFIVDNLPNLSEDEKAWLKTQILIAMSLSAGKVMENIDGPFVDEVEQE